jgi:hypothetical protein
MCCKYLPLLYVRGLLFGGKNRGYAQERSRLAGNGLRNIYTAGKIDSNKACCLIKPGSRLFVIAFI